MCVLFGLLNIEPNADARLDDLIIEKSGLHSLGGLFSASATGLVNDLDLTLELEKLPDRDRGLELLDENGE